MNRLDSLLKLSRIRAERERIALMRSLKQRSRLEQTEANFEAAEALMRQIESDGNQSVTDAFSDLTETSNAEQRVDAMLRAMDALENRKTNARKQLARTEAKRKNAKIDLSVAIAEHGTHKRALETLEQIVEMQINDLETQKEHQEAEMIDELAILSKVRQSNV